MMRSRFFWKLYLGTVGLILLTAGIVGLLVDRQVERDSIEEIRESLSAKASLLGAIAEKSLAGEPEPDLQERVQRLGEKTGVRLTVIRASGLVLADSEERPDRMDDHTGRPEIAEAREKGIGAATRYSHTVDKEMMYVAVRVDLGERSVGFARAAVSLASVEERLGVLRGIVAFGASVAAVAGLFFGFVFTRRVTGPLVAMTGVAEGIARGDYGRRIETGGADEVSRLARAIDRMAASCRERMEAVTRERNQLAAVLGGMVEGVVAVDREERIVHMNRIAAVLLDVEPLATVGKPVWEATRISGVVEALRSVMEAGAERAGEIRMTRMPRDRVIELHSAPLLDAQHRVAGAVVVLHDVTELRRLEEVRRDFVASVSHELKTPVAAIQGLVETILDDPGMPLETERRFLDKVRGQSDRLASLVTDLLTLSRLESDPGAMEREEFDLREPAEDSARALAPLGEDRGLSIEVVLPHEPLLVDGNRAVLRQIVDNLLDNAIKYTPAGGRVSLRLRREGDGAEIEIEDTGIGIEPAHQERIFERFYRVDKARSRELGGTGLGLSIVKHAAVAHGGSVSVESAPGRGSVFRVRLPLVQHSARAHPSGE